jgi:Flp pilus assembly protein TadB
MEIIAAYIDLVIMYLNEIDIFGILAIALFIVIVVVLSLRYGKGRKKMRELKRQRKMLTARLDELAGGRKKLRL